MARETQEQALSRWEDLIAVQEAYPNFPEFLYDVMTDLMGFQCTWLQEDIGEYLQTGPKYRMIQAQRGQAKTTITAIYAVWRLIHNPSTRVVILSAGGAMASQISGWIIQIINGMEILECLRPDKSQRDRTSIEAYDVHYTLKGPEKSPSVACLGATSNMQGYRADVLIADDIESKKNAGTAVQRAKLIDITRDFTSICSKGDIIYLGTPQSVDSIYNTLTSRGYDIRVWTGRFPTQGEIPNYEGTLAPKLLDMLRANPSLCAGGGPMGDRGVATDEVIVPERILTEKEVDQGPAYFQLQFMLDTALMDVDRYPLKPENLFFTDLRDQDRAPVDMKLIKNPALTLPVPAQFPLGLTYYQVTDTGSLFCDYEGTHMYVDPAGGGKNGDETAYAITRSAGGKIFVVACGGVEGGLDPEKLDQLTALAVKHRVTAVSVEKNFGNGALSNVWQPKLISEAKLVKLNIGIEDVWESGQKELRIIDILEPIMAAGKLIIDMDIIEQDWIDCSKYPLQDRPTYSLFWQMARLTRDKNCLIHDDRLDALAGSVRYWVDSLVKDENKALQEAGVSAWKRMMKNPLGSRSGPRSMLGSQMNTPNNRLKRRH